jgi:2-polyprenyl-3-methyl-5-hydroxy-6-metoxy-1,4-benzoquinol methylase
MNKKESRIENWNDSYESFSTTYSESVDTPSNLSNNMQWQFVLEDIQELLPESELEKLRILECGCGGARTSLFLAQRGYNVTCTDYAPEAVRLAKDNFSSCGLEGHVVQDDLLNSELPEGSFDCVMSFGLLEHFEELDPLIESTTKLVKPGGIQIHCVIPKKFSTQTIMNILFYPLRFLKNLSRGNYENIFRASFRDFPHYENTFSAKEYAKSFEKHGSVVLKNQPGGIVFSLVSLPLGIGPLIVRSFSDSLCKLIRRVDRTESDLLHYISPTFYIVCRKK